MLEQRARDGGTLARASPNEEPKSERGRGERESERVRDRERERVLRAPVRESHSTHHRKADCERRMQRGMLAMQALE